MEALSSRRPVAVGWLAGLLLLLALAAPLARWERGLADLLVWRSLPPAADLVLVDIDEASLIALGAWPWSRPQLAELADKIAKAGARRQVWDIVLAEERAGDAALQAVLHKEGIALGAVAVIDPAVDSPPRLGSLHGMATPWQNLCAPGSPFPLSLGHLGVAATLTPASLALGHLTPRIDQDGRLRGLPAVVCDGETGVPSLMLGLLEPAAGSWVVQAGAWPWSAPWTLVRGQERIPLDAEGSIRLDFRTPLAEHLTVPAHRVLAGDLPAGLLAGKTVLLGASSLGLGDRVATRLSPLTPGMAVHAELHARLQDGQWTAPLRNGVAVVLLLAALLSLPWVLRPGLPRPWLLAPAVALPLLLVYLANHGWGVPVLPALLWFAQFALLLLALRLVEERQARRFHQRRLASIIPPALLEQLDPEAPSDIIAAKRRSFGLVHGQLRNLPQFANREEPEKVLAVFHALNRLAQQVARRHGAQLYPSEMQAFLLVWPDLADAAGSGPMLRAARELHRGVSALLGELEAASGLALEIAVHIDEALDGFIGSHERRRPVLYGRLRQVTEAMLGLSAELASPILVSDRALPGEAAACALRDLGQFRLEDISRPHALYACMQTLDPLPECEA